MLEKFYKHETTLSEEKKTQLGIVYTPPHIVGWINNRVLSLWDKPHPPKVIDPCCGTGVFLYDMAQKISSRWQLSLEEVYENYIFGSDLDDVAIDIGTRLLPSASLRVADGLSISLADYDIVVTNPPYIRIQNLDKQTRAKISENYSCCKGDTDIYIAFFEKILRSGVLSGFICPNSWIKNKSSSSLRSLVRDLGRADTIIDFKSERVFKGVGTYTSILVFDNKPVPTVQAGSSLDQLTVSEGSDIFVGDVLLVDKDERAFVKGVLSRQRSILDLCDINVGLATLCDSVFLLELVKRGAKVSLVKQRKKGSPLFEIENSIILNCVKGGDITKNLDKEYVIIYPYDEQRKALSEERLREDYPKAFSYLVSNKEKLLKRDKGKPKGYAWHAYGRTQALGLTEKEKLVFPAMVKDRVHLKECGQSKTFISGYCLVPKESSTIDEIRRVFTSDEVSKWIRIFGKNMGNNWLGISKETFKKYRI